MLSLGGKSLIRTAIDRPRDEDAAAGREQGGGRAQRAGLPGKQPEYRRPAARHRRVRGSVIAQEADQSGDLRMPLGHYGLEVVHQLALPMRATLGSAPTARAQPAERLSRADGERRQEQDHPGWRTIAQREEPIAALETEHGAPLEEIRNVGAKRRADLM